MLRKTVYVQTHSLKNGAILESYQGNLLTLGGELCSSWQEVTIAFNFVTGHTAVQYI
jgi:hypothetical protein